MNLAWVLLFLHFFNQNRNVKNYSKKKPIFLPLRFFFTVTVLFYCYGFFFTVTVKSVGHEGKICLPSNRFYIQTLKKTELR